MPKKRKPGRPKSKPSTVRSQIVPLRLTAAERRTLQNAAVQAGQTLSDWMRQRLVDMPSAASRILDAVGADPTPLGELYRRLQVDGAAVSLGQFHDALRDLAAAGRVHLSPWTGAMYQLADPECCLIQGREVMAYAARTP